MKLLFAITLILFATAIMIMVVEMIFKDKN